MIRRSPAGCLLALLLVACASGTPSEPREADLSGTPGCFNVRDVENFRVIDRSRLIVFAPNDSRAYQVRITPATSALRSAVRIAFDSRSGRVCGYAGDSIYFNGSGSTRYAVTDVRRLDRMALEMIRSPEDAELEPETEAAAEIESLDGPEDGGPDEQAETGEP